MLRTLCCFALVAACALGLAGCAGADTVTLTHVFPPSGVKLEGARRIQLMGLDSAPAGSAQLQMVRECLGRIGGIQVVDSEPDYWLVAGWMSGYGQSTEQQQRFSSRTGRVVREGRRFGHEEVMIQPQVTTSCVLVATFSLVRASDLTPVTMFNVGMYDGDFSEHGGRSLEMYDLSFRRSLEARLREVFIPGNRSIEHATVVPDNSPRELLSALGKGSPLAVMPDFGQFCGGIREYPGDSEQMLTNYFLCFLNEELGCTDVPGLRSLHGRYLQLVKLSGNETLQEAASRAMARVEEKLRLLGHRPLA